MVNVTYTRTTLPKGWLTYRLEAEGHADYSKNKEPDIVCASVSTLFYTLANFLELIGAEDLSGSDDGDFFVECNAVRSDETVHTAFRMTVFGLTLLQEEYPDNISFSDESD